MRKTKILFICITAVLVTTVTILGTLSYLTSKDAVVNTFTVGKVNIELDESLVTADGESVLNADRVKENKYHLIPGRTYVKDPTVTVNSGSEESYIRMVVVLDHYKELREIFGDDFLPEKYISGWNPKIWVSTKDVKVDLNENTASYEFRYYKTVSAQKDTPLEPLFSSITVPEEITGDELEKIEGFNVTVFGHAIQSANLANEDTAWLTFEKQIKN